MQSRLSVYLHPLAGRPLCWHVLRALAAQSPPPRELLVVGGVDLPPELLRESEPPVRLVASLPALLADWPPGEPLLLVDAAAPALREAIGRLLLGPEEAALAAPDGTLAAVRLASGRARDLLGAAAALRDWGDAVPAHFPRVEDPAAVVVRDRVTLARAGARLRDAVVEKLMRRGVTFLLPETVLVDVEVQIGRDCIVYPGVVIEGQTTIGEETVIGPGTRIIDSWIGSGVEMKGWNYISHTSIRNRAILEPHVRRGFE